MQHRHGGGTRRGVSDGQAPQGAPFSTNAPEMRLASGGSPRDVLAMRRVGTLLLDLKRTPPQKAAPNGRAGNRIQSSDVIPEPSEYAASLEAAQTGDSRIRR